MEKEFVIQDGVLIQYNGGEYARIPDGVVEISPYAFHYTIVERLVIPEGVTRLRENTFAKCEYLWDVTLPSTLEVIEDMAFDHPIKELTVPKSLREKPLSWWRDAVGEDDYRRMLFKMGDLSEREKRYLRRQRQLYFRNILDEGRLDMLETFLTLNKKIPLYTLDDYINEAQRREKYEILARLLEYKNEKYPRKTVERIEARRQRVALGEATPSVEDYKRIFKIRKNKTGITIVGYLGMDNIITFPAYIGRTRVTEILDFIGYEKKRVSHKVLGHGLHGYSRRDEIKEINLPATLEKIGPAAFFHLSSVKEIHIPNGVVEIGDGAFCGCDSIKEITIPPTVERIGYGAFSGCDLLEAVHLPEPLPKIGAGAFSRCPAFVDGDGFTIVGDTLYGYYGSKARVRIPDNIREISDYAFHENKNLKHIILPKSLEKIGFSAFVGCAFLERIDFPPHEISIAAHAFGECDALANKDGMIIVKNILYGYIGKSQSVRVPDGIVEIDGSSFYRCEAKMDIYIPASVKKMDDNMDSGFGAYLNFTAPKGSYGEKYAKRRQRNESKHY